MYKRILVPTDGSTLAEEAAHAAIVLAKKVDASVVGFYAMPSYDASGYETVVMSPGWIPEEEFNKAQQGHAKKYLSTLEKMATESGVSYESYSQTAQSAAMAIVDAAKEKQCDLIFIGSHGRGALAQVFLGSVTTKVLSLCSLPVLVHRQVNVA